MIPCNNRPQKLALLILSGSLMMIFSKLDANAHCLTDHEGINGIRCVSIRPVFCACPCDQYNHYAERDTCLRCGHYHAGDSLMQRQSRKPAEPWELLDLEPRACNHKHNS